MSYSVSKTAATSSSRVSRGLALLGIVVWLGIDTASCATLVAPVRLKLISVELVQQSQISASQRWWNAGDISTPLLRVIVASTTDFQRFAKSGDYNITVLTADCRNGEPDKSKLLEGYPHVVDHYGWIYTYRKIGIDTSRASGMSAGPIEYTMYLAPRQPGTSGFRGYDLVRDPRDVCVGVFGTVQSYLGGGFTSNTIRLPADTISAILRRGGLQ